MVPRTEDLPSMRPNLPLLILNLSRKVNQAYTLIVLSLLADHINRAYHHHTPEPRQSSIPHP